MLRAVYHIQCSGNFLLVQNSAEMPPDPPEEIFRSFHFCGMRAVQATPLLNDCYTSSLKQEPPKSVTIKINIDDDKAKSQVATTMMESSFLVETMVRGYHV